MPYINLACKAGFTLYGGLGPIGTIPSMARPLSKPNTPHRSTVLGTLFTTMWHRVELVFDNIDYRTGVLFGTMTYLVRLTYHSMANPDQRF